MLVSPSLYCMRLVCGECRYIGDCLFSSFHESLQIALMKCPKHVPPVARNPKQPREITYSVALFHLPPLPPPSLSFTERLSAREVEWPQQKTEIASGGGNRERKTCEGERVSRWGSRKERRANGVFESITTPFSEEGGNICARRSHL